MVIRQRGQYTLWPYQFAPRRACERCGSKALTTTEDGQSCVPCGWRSYNGGVLAQVVAQEERADRRQRPVATPRRVSDSESMDRRQADLVAYIRERGGCVLRQTALRETGETLRLIERAVKARAIRQGRNEQGRLTLESI